MTDIPVDPAAADPTAVDSPIDPAFADLVAKLGPIFTEVAKATIAEAIAATPTVSYRPGVVQGVTAADRTVSVLLDGDTTAITAQVLTELPYTGGRVMVEFTPAGAVFVIGFVGGCGVPPGTLAPFAGPITVHADATTAQPTSNQPPAGWLWCAGQAVSRATYSALFAAIGTTYGAGDGSTTFNVPDLRGRALVGLDNMGGSDAGRIGTANTLGTAAGSNTISSSMLPAHTHGFTPSGSVSLSGLSTSTDGSHSHNISTNAHTLTGSGGVPNWDGANGTLGFSFVPTSWTGASPSSDTQGSHSHSVSGSASFTGSGGSTDNGPGSSAEHLPPHMVVHVIIKA